MAERKNHRTGTQNGSQGGSGSFPPGTVTVGLKCRYLRKCTFRFVDIDHCFSVFV